MVNLRVYSMTLSTILCVFSYACYSEFDIRPGSPPSRHDSCSRRAEQSITYMMPTCQFIHMSPLSKESSSSMSFVR